MYKHGAPWLLDRLLGLGSLEFGGRGKAILVKDVAGPPKCTKQEPICPTFGDLKALIMGIWEVCVSLKLHDPN